MTVSHRYQINRSGFLAILVVVLLGLLALTQSQSDAAAAPVWVDYDIHERGVIEVKLYDDLPLRAQNGRLRITGNSKQNNTLAPVLQELPDGVWQPVFETDDAALSQWRQTAAANTGKHFPDLALYFRVQLPDGVEAAEVIGQFRASPLVEGAYPVSKPAPPPIPPDYETNNDSNFDAALNLNMYQRYLDAAPDGMDVRYAWEGTGGRGSGIDICDVEYGWNPHNDLPPISLLKLPINTYTNDFYEHGTAVLGMLGGLDNGWGVTGMISDARFFFSPVHPIGGSFNVATAISHCTAQLNPGDVMIIEQQTGGRNGNYVPVEWDPSAYAMIKTAVAIGITVVEAAGNGGEDLDNVFYQTAKPGHTPFTAAGDSGAIIVGSANSPWTTDPRTRADGSTYGDTVDLNGWGMHLIAPGYGDYYNDEGDVLSYTLFGGTSGASPMITAAAAIIQANYIAKDGAPSSPAQVKQLLQSSGTPQESVNGENIGPMPDLRSAINTLWNITEPTMPVISPASGAYSPPLQVTIDYGSAAQNSSNTHIRYTLDGSEPTIDSFIYIPEQGDVIHLLYTATVRAKAFSSHASAGRFFASPTATANFGLVAPKVSAPQITPNGGNYGQGQTVTISSATPGATIKYRTDGRAPSFFYPGTTYNGPITLSPGTYNIAARAYKDGYYNSDPAYTDQLVITPVTLPAPSIYPNGGTYAGEATVYLGSTVLGGQIRYTTDGSTPTGTSPLYVDPLAITGDTTVKARLYLDGYTASATTSAAFTIIGQTAAPVFSPNSGTAANDSLSVSLSSATAGATIRYTTNGAEPTAASPLYAGPFTLDPGQHTVKARAFLNGATDSPVTTATYTVYDTSVSVDPPAIAPFGGNFNGPITVTLTSDTEGAFLFYTLDGTDPATSPTVIPYSGPFPLNGDATYFVRARAYKSGIGNSAMTAATIVVVNPALGPVQTPTISPPGGQYTNTIAVTVQAPDWSSPFNIRKLYVTTDGAEPVADFTSPGDGASGTYNFNVSSPTTVKALSAQAGWFDSDVAMAEYAFICDTPAITTGGTFTDTANVSISAGTSSATIYYTTDGSEPTTADTVYGSPFTLTQSQVIKAMCVRNNFEQSDTAVSVFIINETPVAPSITAQPQSQSVNTCTAATFSVTAAGSAPFTYEWYKDGDIIGGATEPTLTLVEALPADAGNYTVLVRNSAGEVTSNTAVLTVSGPDVSCGPSYEVYLPAIIK